MTAQVPTAAKVRYLEGARSSIKGCMAAPRADPEIVRVWEYQIEVIEAILADYQKIAKTMTSADHKRQGIEGDDDAAR